METQDELKTAIMSAITRDYPKAFWEEAREAARQTYLDVFHQVSADPNILPDQRLDFLFQARHFRMEHVFMKLAERHSLPSTATLLVSNNRRYVLVTKGSIAMTQAYVQTIGAMPKPARYRERHAQINALSLQPQLDLGREPREAFLPKEFYGLLAHNPVGNRFDEQDQRLGMLQFCVPMSDCSAWVVELTMEEIISSYDAPAKDAKLKREMPWKKIEKKGEE